MGLISLALTLFFTAIALYSSYLILYTTIELGRLLKKALLEGWGALNSFFSTEGARYLTEQDIEYIALHEAGHAAVWLTVAPELVQEANITKAEIVFPDSKGGRVLIHKPTNFNISRTKAEKIVSGFYGGMAAEEILLGEYGGGSYSDMRRAVMEASDIMKLYGIQGKTPMSHELLMEYSLDQEDINEVLATEAERILTQAYVLAKEIVSQRKPLVEAVAKELVNKRHLTNQELLELNQKYP